MAADIGEEERPDPDEIKGEMGALIHDLQTEAGLSVTALAAIVGRTRMTVSNWIAGREMPGQDAVDALKERFPDKADELQSLRDAFVDAKALDPSASTPEADGDDRTSRLSAELVGAGPTVTEAVANSAVPVAGSRNPRKLWTLALPILLLLGMSGVYLILTTGADGSIEACNEPHPLVDARISASFTQPTEPIPKLSDDGAVAGIYSGILGEEQLWLFIMAIDVNKYWPTEQPMALDRANKTWRLIGGSLHLGNDDPGQVGRRFEAALGLVEPYAIADMGEANEIGGWTVDQLPEGVTLIACASIYRA